jgi:hypothetical protein
MPECFVNSLRAVILILEALSRVGKVDWTSISIPSAPKGRQILSGAKFGFRQTKLFEPLISKAKMYCYVLQQRKLISRVTDALPGQQWELCFKKLRVVVCIVTQQWEQTAYDFLGN